MTILVDQNICLWGSISDSEGNWKKNQMTYTLQVTMYYVVQMEIVKAIHYVPQLQNSTFNSTQMVMIKAGSLTRLIQSTFGFLLT